ncbi:MAG: hypothetical protein RR263_03180 [Oscillospiraceae bacterium]
MSEINCNTNPHDHGCFKEAVCIDAGRIFDSCSDKDCVENLQVHFTDVGQRIIDQALGVKCKHAKVASVYLDVESVPFNKGFYSVDITFFFILDIIASTCATSQGVSVKGIATFSKKVILFGSEGSVRVFSSTEQKDCPGHRNSANPTATVQVVDPIVLSCRLLEFRGECDPMPGFPSHICEEIDGTFCPCIPSKIVVVTLGLFTIVQLERRVQMMIPVYDYCVPDKESITTTGDPCEMFRKIKFPTSDFFPPRLNDLECDD